MSTLEPTSTPVTQLLHDFKAGDQAAKNELFEMIYRELHRLAKRYMSQERANHTLQATALVHEAYFKLCDQKTIKWQNKAHFLAISAQIMRRILIDHARAKCAGKRGAGAMPVTLDEGLVANSQDGSQLLALEDALKKLEGLSERQSKVVELRYFGGLSIEETAAVVESSPATVKRDWTVAKAFLQKEMASE